ncbi:MAG: RluA family pseudouridine synthase [Planctomycetaceae bacterium]
MALTTVSIKVDEGQAGRVDVLVQRATGVSRSQVRGLVDHGCVLINAAPCNTLARQVSVGDIVSVRYDPAQKYHEKKKRWDDRTFTVIYEDDDLIVVDKSAGVLTVPTDWNEKNTLVDRVSLCLSHSRKRRTACVVHRLDREVSGLLVFGKHEAAAELLIEQFKQRKPERRYIAIVAGLMEADEGTFDAHLATAKNLDRYVARPSRNTEAAITHYRVLRRMSDTTLVEVSLETGKRNQIRVHFANAGHPVLGDPRYRTQQAKHPRWIRQRMALHAKTLGFVHPVTGQPMQFESPLPSAIHKFLAGSR